MKLVIGGARRGARAVFAAALAAALLAGCTHTPVGPLETGVWGGAQGNLTVYRDSATLELACAAGRIPSPLTIDIERRLDVPGFYARVAGPIGVGGLDWLPARYLGDREGDVLMLLIIAQSDTIGPLELRRGVTGQFPVCLSASL